MLQREEHLVALRRAVELGERLGRPTARLRRRRLLQGEGRVLSNEREEALHLTGLHEAGIRVDVPGIADLRARPLADVGFTEPDVAVVLGLLHRLRGRKLALEREEPAAQPHLHEARRLGRGDGLRRSGARGEPDRIVSDELPGIADRGLHPRRLEFRGIGDRLLLAREGAHREHLQARPQSLEVGGREGHRVERDPCRLQRREHLRLRVELPTRPRGSRGIGSRAPSDSLPASPRSARGRRVERKRPRGPRSRTTAEQVPVRAWSEDIREGPQRGSSLAQRRERASRLPS